MSPRLGSPIGDAALRVLALVSGMPASRRMNRGLLMLQAYIDESVNHDGGSLFVMAGYVATVEQWMAFSDEWARVLTLKSPHYRRISEFHMVDMVQCPVALEQSEIFFRVIEKHLHLYVSCAVRLDDLKQEHQKIAWPKWLDNIDIFTNEYYTGFDQIIRSLAVHAERLGIKEPVDVIFDNHSNHAKCLRGWEIMKRYGHPDVRRMLGDTPIFRDSKTTMPLQAADLLAYWLRKSQLKKPLDDPDFKLEFPWQRTSTHMQGLATYCTPEMLRNRFRDTILACSLLRAGLSPALVSAIVLPRKVQAA